MTAFDQLASLLRARSGLVIGPDKLYLLEVRLGPILQRERLRDLAALADRLLRPGAEAIAEAVVEAMTTNESLFFRDQRPFANAPTRCRRCWPRGRRGRRCASGRPPARRGRRPTRSP